LALIRSYWGIENGLHYRRDVSLLEDATRMTNHNLAHAKASLNNLVLGIFMQKSAFPSLPTARRYYDANLEEAFGLIVRLIKKLGCRVGLFHRSPGQQSGISWPSGGTGGFGQHLKDLLKLRG
jgi:hypothetical protein